MRTALVLLLALANATHAQEEGDWKTLFDGKTLDGWVTSGGRYDGEARWTVEDGTLTGRQTLERKGGLIYTEDLYADFELELEVKIDYPFDSGIFLRMVPEEKGAQVTVDWRPGGEIGGIYSDGWLKHTPEGAEKFEKDGWNHFRVICRGKRYHLRAWLNGEQIVEFELPEEATGYAPSGRIGLQVHGGENVPPETKVQYRNVRVRELPLAREGLFTETEDGLLSTTHRGLLEGWRPLFNGRDMSGWEVVGDEGGFGVDNGELNVATGGGGYIATKQDFEDFELQLDFKTGKMANSGLFLRGKRGGDNPAYSGCEVQILDDFNWESETKSTLKPWQFTGSLYGAVPPGDRSALRPLGEWNRYEVLYQGPRLRVRLNGVELYDVQTHELEVEPPFAERAPLGFIGLQRHSPPSDAPDSGVWFRNIFARRL